MKKILAGYAFFIGINAVAQQDSTTINKGPSVSPLTFSGYAEGYYSYDFNKPANNTRPGFLYNYNRHNEFNLNLGFVKASYAAERARANLAVGVGTYMNANYAAEPGPLKNIYEANAGYKLSAEKNLWFDIGILPSHIGFESAVGKDDRALTRSLAAESTPYFEGGARLIYTTDDGKLSLAGLLLNGWQRITRVDGNSLMSYGTQVYYKPSDKVTINYSAFFGTDKPDSARQWRYYHNLYGIFRFTGKIELTLGFDYGREQKSKTNHYKNNLYTPVGILHITPSDKWGMALRGEYYNDKDGIIIATGTPHGFKTAGFSVNADYLPEKNTALRLELRNFRSRDKIFRDQDNQASKNNTMLTFSTAVSF